MTPFDDTTHEETDLSLGGRQCMLKLLQTTRFCGTSHCLNGVSPSDTVHLGFALKREGTGFTTADVSPFVSKFSPLEAEPCRVSSPLLVLLRKEYSNVHCDINSW